MKMKELVKAFEEYRADSDAQIKQLRDEVAKMMSQLNDKPKVVKNSDADYGRMVQDMLSKHHEHPLIKGRDLFTMHGIYNLVISFLPEDKHLMGNVTAFETRSNVQFRRLSIKLVNSGLFQRRKTQRYMPAHPELGLKPTRRRFTCIIAANFDKYESMSENILDNMMCEQDRKAQAAYQVKVKEQVAQQAKAESTELDTQVSFL